MSIVSVIAEYNPFHNGHLYHLNKAKQITGSENAVVVLSGNFVQRGEPAILDKYCRTKMALNAGADLVIELPVYYASASAEFFAYGAIKILNSIGISESICFGSECGDIEILKQISYMLANENNEFKENLKHNLSKGISYPKARELSVNTELSEYLNQPNNILAIEYIKQIIKTDSKLIPFTFKREIAGYHDTTLYETIQSATAIRHSILNFETEKTQNVMPESSYNILKNELENGMHTAEFNNLSYILHYIIRNNGLQYLMNIEGMTEGIENRLIKACYEKFYIDDIIKHIKTKRYTFTAIQRLVLRCLLGITKEDTQFFMEMRGPQYIRVLGFRKESAHLLAQIEQKASLPLITNIKHADKILPEAALKMLDKEIKTTDIYYMSTNNYKNKPTPKLIEYRKPVIVV